MKKNKDIELIDQLIDKYLAGDPKALTEILKNFDVYFKKYVSILKGRYVDLHNQDTYRFYSLFLPKQEKSVPNILMVKNSLTAMTADLEEDDIYQELVCLFIEKILKKYHRVHEPGFVRGVNFVNYMTKIFRFRVKDWCNEMILHKLQSEGTIEDCEIQVHDIKNDVEELTLNWVVSPTSEAFKQLTGYQRYIIYLKYVKGLSTGEIAKLLNKNRDFICQQVRNTERQLRQTLDYDREDTGVDAEG